MRKGTNELTHLDLFSGIGGFSLAFEREGFKTIGFSEIEPYACAVLRRHWPNVPNFGAVQNVTRNSVLERCGCLPVVVTGGFPCQPHSLAGKRKAADDERDLWAECVRVLREIRPRFALFENVAGLLTSGFYGEDETLTAGLFFNRVLSYLAEIRYACLWQVISAADIGAPHRRDRVWLLCVDELANSDSGRRDENREPSKLRANRVKQPSRHCWNCDAPEREEIWPSASGLWPSRPGEAQHDWEPPRVVGNANDDMRRWREQRLHATSGNDIGHETIAKCSKIRDSQAQPNLGGSLDGLPAGMDATANRVPRLKCLGNSIVPQVAQVFARAIRRVIEAEKDAQVTP